MFDIAIKSFEDAKFADSDNERLPPATSGAKATSPAVAFPTTKSAAKPKN